MDKPTPLHTSTYLYGYRSDEVNLKIPTEPDFSLCSIRKKASVVDRSYRPPMAQTMLPHVPAVLPRPDISDYPSAVAGIAKRMAYKPPRYDRRLRRQFRKFVRRWLEDNMIPLDPNFQFNVDDWLETTNYPDWRKRDIKKIFDEGIGDNEHQFEKGYYKKGNVGIFTKEEFHEEYKFHRTIWAREDAFKAFAGPFFRAIENELFKLPYFIKKVPKHERPQFIMEFIGKDGLKYQCTDYSSFESLFTTDLMDDCEFELYRYMSSLNPDAQKICFILFKVLADDNICKQKYFKIRVNAKRMSGEMNTSLGNSFSNLMIMKFAFWLYEIEHTGPIVEGDDGLAGINKNIPPIFFQRMGLNVKMKTVEKLSEASFCGMIFDESELINIRDPMIPLATTVWVPRKYAFCGRKTYFELIKSRALSLIYEYPGCPVLYPYGLKIFELLKDYEVVENPRHLTNYELQQYQKAYEAYVTDTLPQREIGPMTRLLMEKIFDIDVPSQLAMEHEISSMTFEGWECSTITSFMPELWKRNYNVYSMSVVRDTYHSITHPPLMLPKYAPNHFILRSPGKFMKNNKLLTYNEFLSIMKYNNITPDANWIKRYWEYVDRKEDCTWRQLINHAGN
jgi:hypothetical protein